MIQFDALKRLIVVDPRSTVDAAFIFHRWKEWQAASDNAKYPPPFHVVGAGELGPATRYRFLFLVNGWKILSSGVPGTIHSDESGAVFAVLI